MSAITAKASRKMKKYAVLTREPRCFLGSFDFSWEQRKLGDIASDMVAGGDIDKDLILAEGQYPVIANALTGDGIVGYYDKEYRVNAPAVTVTGRGDVGHAKARLVNFTPVVRLLSVKSEHDVFFLENAINTLKIVIESTGVPQLTVPQLAKYEVAFPRQLDEEEHIGAFFKQLDHLITLHQRKCANLCSPSQVVFSLLFATSTFSWEQRKFSDITFPAGEKNKDNLPLESYSITNEHGFVPQDEKFENGGTMREADKRMYYIVSPNSFAYNPARINVGSIGYQNIGKNVIVSSLYEVFKTSEDVDDRLLWHWFKSPDFQKLIMQLQEGGVRLYFYYDKLCMGEVSLPSLEEQRKIGKLFDTLDNLITLHQRECISFTGRADRLILTANKKRTTSSWEQRKLGDVADIVGGGTPSTGNQSYWDGDIDWYAPAEIADQIYANSSQKKITGLGYENSSAKMLPPGTVLFTSRAGIGKTAILTRKGCTNQGFQSIVPHRGELDSYFIFSRTEELKRYGELVGAGSTFVEVSGKQMAVMELMMPPTMREQQTIGGFFQQLDHLITLHQRKPFLMKWRTSDANRNQTNRLVL